MKSPVLALLAAAVLVLSGCDFGSSSPSDGLTGEEAAKRLAKAEALYFAAVREMPKDKPEILRKLVAFYPESPRVTEAYFHLVFYLLDPSAAKPDEAFEAASEFADRCPTEPLVSEAWKIQDAEAGRLLDTARRARVQARWSAWLDRARKEFKSEDRVAKARLWRESADCAMRQRDPKRALEFLAEATSWDLRQRDLTLDLLCMKAQIEARDLGLKADAAATYEKALVLARAGVLGETPERIEAFLADLKN